MLVFKSKRVFFQWRTRQARLHIRHVFIIFYSIADQQYIAILPACCCPGNISGCL